MEKVIRFDIKPLERYDLGTVANYLNEILDLGDEDKAESIAVKLYMNIDKLPVTKGMISSDDDRWFLVYFALSMYNQAVKEVTKPPYNEEEQKLIKERMREQGFKE